MSTFDESKVTRHTNGRFANKTHAEGDVDLSPTPICSVNELGIRRWTVDGVLHRDGGPAVVWPNGSEAWYRHGELHRDGAPAVWGPAGDEKWYRHGRLHRDDGPALITASGLARWFKDGEVVPGRTNLGY